eukprot:15037647-Alexandrium_andersonii.AAC.2
MGLPPLLYGLGPAVVRGLGGRPSSLQLPLCACSGARVRGLGSGARPIPVAPAETAPTWSRRSSPRLPANTNELCAALDELLAHSLGGYIRRVSPTRPPGHLRSSKSPARTCS